MDLRIPEPEFEELTVHFDTLAGMFVKNGITVHPCPEIVMKHIKRHRHAKAFPSGEDWWLEVFLHKMLIRMVEASMLWHKVVPLSEWVLHLERISLEGCEEGHQIIRVEFGFQPLRLMWVGAPVGKGEKTPTDNKSETISVKGGSLDEPVDITNAVHIWTSSKLPSVVIPQGTKRFTEEPD